MCTMKIVINIAQLQLYADFREKILVHGMECNLWLYSEVKRMAQRDFYVNQ